MKRTVLLAVTLVLIAPGVWGKAKPKPTPAPAAETLEAPLPPPSELFQQAQDAFKDKRYKESQDLLVRLVAGYPLAEYIPKAKLLLANLERDFQSSLDKFRSLAAEYTGKPEGEEALKSMGNRYYVADKYAEAADAYREFLERYPKSSYVPEVGFFYGTSLLAQGESDEAIPQFAKVVKEAPDSTWAPKALLGLGTAHLKKQEPEKARKTFLRILDEYPLFEELNIVYYRLAQAFEAQKKTREAHAAYATLVTKYPKAFEAGVSKERMRELEAADPALKPSEEELPEAPTPVVVVKENPTPQPVTRGVKVPPSRAKPFHVQVGVFTQKANADKLKAKCWKAGYTASVILSQTEDMPYPYYKVRVGSWADRPQAKYAADKIAKRLKQQAVVVED